MARRTHPTEPPPDVAPLLPPPPTDQGADELLAAAILIDPPISAQIPAELLALAPISQAIADAIHTIGPDPTAIARHLAEQSLLGTPKTTYRSLANLVQACPSARLARCKAESRLRQLARRRQKWLIAATTLATYLETETQEMANRPTAHISTNGTICVSLNGRLLTCDRRNWASSRTRNAFLRDLQATHPDIDTTELAAQLLAHAANHSHPTDPPLPGQPIQFDEPPTPTQPKPILDTLDHLERILSAHIHAPSHVHVAIALWAAHTHHIEQANISPMLAITSPTKRCGKTRTLQLLAAVVRRPVFAASLTPPAAYRLLDEHSPITLLIDEADAQHLNELRGILNAGHTRDTAHVFRCVGEQHQVRLFRTFGPKAVAGIGTLPSTWLDRAIHIQLSRRPQHDAAPAFDAKTKTALRTLAGHLYYSLKHTKRTTTTTPTPPLPIHDRARENWAPLLAIADLAGPPWPARARHAAIALTSQNHDPIERLIVDLCHAAPDPTERLTASELCRRLLSDPASPWHSYRGEPLSPANLGKILAQFRIPQTRTADARTYLAADIHAAAQPYR